MINNNNFPFIDVKCTYYTRMAARAGATFNWTLFDNSNRRKVVRRPSKVVMFDLNYVRRKIDNCRT